MFNVSARDFTKNTPHLTRSEAARYLGVSRRSMDNWATQGRGPRFYRIGRAARYRLSDLEAWLEARVVHGDQGGEGAA